jgi:hypothetical protein
LLRGNQEVAPRSRVELITHKGAAVRALPIAPQPPRESQSQLALTTGRSFERQELVHKDAEHLQELSLLLMDDEALVRETLPVHAARSPHQLEELFHRTIASTLGRLEGIEKHSLMRAMEVLENTSATRAVIVSSSVMPTTVDELRAATKKVERAQELLRASALSMSQSDYAAVHAALLELHTAIRKLEELGVMSHLADPLGRHKAMPR